MKGRAEVRAQRVAVAGSSCCCCCCCCWWTACCGAGAGAAAATGEGENLALNRAPKPLCCCPSSTNPPLGARCLPTFNLTPNLHNPLLHRLVLFFSLLDCRPLLSRHPPHRRRCYFFLLIAAACRLARAAFTLSLPPEVAAGTKRPPLRQPTRPQRARRLTTIVQQRATYAHLTTSRAPDSLTPCVARRTSTSLPSRALPGSCEDTEETFYAPAPQLWVSASNTATAGLLAAHFAQQSRLVLSHKRTNPDFSSVSEKTRHLVVDLRSALHILQRPPRAQHVGHRSSSTDLICPGTSVPRGPLYHLEIIPLHCSPGQQPRRHAELQAEQKLQWRQPAIERALAAAACLV